MFKKIFWRKKIRNYVSKIHKNGGNYSIILSVENSTYKVWDVVKRNRNTYLLTKSTKSCSKVNGSECDFLETKELQIPLPKSAVEETLTNEIMEYYPNDNLQSFITI